MKKKPSEPEPTRPMQKSDYALIYKLIEHGTTRETICDTFGLKPHTLYLRLRADRPDLAKKTKSLPTNKRVSIAGVTELKAVVAARGRKTIDGLSLLLEHDVDVLAERARRQQERVANDPLAARSTLVLDKAKDLKALVQVGAMIPGMGFVETKAAASTHIQVNTSTTLNHATVMRQDGGLLEDEIPEAAIVDLDALPLADRIPHEEE